MPVSGAASAVTVESIDVGATGTASTARIASVELVPVRDDFCESVPAPGRGMDAGKLGGRVPADAVVGAEPTVEVAPLS